MENGYEFIGIRSTPEIPRREHNTIYRSDQCRIATAMTVPLVAVFVGTRHALRSSRKDVAASARGTSWPSSVANPD